MRAPHIHWTAAERRVLRRRYPHEPTKAIAADLGRRLNHVYAMASRLGLRKTDAYFATYGGGRTDGSRGAGSRFVKGQAPWNKGLHYMPGGRIRDGWFRKGNVSKRWDPEIYTVGALRINSDGYLEIKTRMGLRAWDPMARFVWTTERGAIPPGMVVRALNGDPDDTRIENLHLVSRAEVMRENTGHRLPKPLADAIRLRGALIRSINRREKKHAEQHP